MKRRRFVPTVATLEDRKLLDGDLVAYQFPLYMPDGPPPPDEPPEFYNPPAYYDPDSGDPLAVRPNYFVAEYTTNYDLRDPYFCTPAY
jgi:hypothetical protein